MRTTKIAFITSADKEMGKAIAKGLAPMDYRTILKERK